MPRLRSKRHSWSQRESVQDMFEGCLAEKPSKRKQQKVRVDRVCPNICPGYGSPQESRLQKDSFRTGWPQGFGGGLVGTGLNQHSSCHKGREGKEPEWASGENRECLRASSPL